MMYHGDETITVTLSKNQLLAGISKIVYARSGCRWPSQAMHSITARLWEYMEGLETPKPLLGKDAGKNTASEVENRIKGGFKI